ncbi:Inner membrane protein CreD [Burkholderiaceae bacterium]|nr:Inner membrane protein CreD [Burkholderiaceae bacterium]
MKLSPLIPKVAAVAAIGGLLMLALGRIGDLADERQARFREAERSVEQSQSSRQALLGPVLLSHCVEEWETTVGEGKDRKTQLDKREFMLSAVPRQLAVQAAAAMEPRYRGLFKVNTYGIRATLRAQWAPLVALRPQREHAGSTLKCAAPVAMVAVSDARGIRHAAMTLGSDALGVHSGTLHASHPRGFHASLPEALRDSDEPLSLDVSLELVGTSEFALAPVADDTRMTLDANWPHPSFGGRFLPLAREVRANGFSATWQLSSLATTAGGDFLRGAALCLPNGSEVTADGAGDSAYGGPRRTSAIASAAADAASCIESFSIAFIDPVNPYSLSDRAIKYGLLFIALTFVAVGIVEVLRQLRVHPIQYLLVGAALSIFFLLLLSLSEHLSFGVSYVIAAGACVALLGFYGRHVLHGTRAGALFGASVAALYGVLYALLQMEQTALVIGSVLLFVVLAAVMVLTRRLDWYHVLEGAAPQPLQPATPAAGG